MAGSRVTAARTRPRSPTASATPTVENTPSLAKPMPRNVTPTVAADAAMTLPIETIARRTAQSESDPSRT